MKRRLGRVLAAGVGLAVAGAGLALGARGVTGPPSFERERLELSRAGSQAPKPQTATHLRGFYSGHSLTDGLPEIVERLAEGAGQRFEFEFQSLPGSLIRERTRGPDPSAAGWPGLSLGRNQQGQGLDVGAALRAVSGPPFDVLVVTERHDLPYAIAHEGAVEYLRQFHSLLEQGTPLGRTWLAHSWLEIGPEGVESWIRYEREALVLWECVASAVNRGLGGSARVAVLPAGAALADLVERVRAGRVPALRAVAGTDPGFLFRDSVHPSAWGRLYLGAVHYAALWGQPPRLSAQPEARSWLPSTPAESGLEPPEALAARGRLALALLEQAWASVGPYLGQATQRANRPAELCRDYAQYFASRFAAHPRGRETPGWLQRVLSTYRLRRALRDAPGF